MMLAGQTALIAQHLQISMMTELHVTERGEVGIVRVFYQNSRQKILFVLEGEGLNLNYCTALLLCQPSAVGCWIPTELQKPP